MRDGIRSLGTNMRCSGFTALVFVAWPDQPLPPPTRSGLLSASKPCSAGTTSVAKQRPGHKFRCIPKLFSNAPFTTIARSLSSIPWASFRAKRGGILLSPIQYHDDDLNLPTVLQHFKNRRFQHQSAPLCGVPGGMIPPPLPSQFGGQPGCRRRSAHRRGFTRIHAASFTQLVRIAGPKGLRQGR